MGRLYRTCARASACSCLTGAQVHYQKFSWDFGLRRVTDSLNQGCVKVKIQFSVCHTGSFVVPRALALADRYTPKEKCKRFIFNFQQSAFLVSVRPWHEEEAGTLSSSLQCSQFCIVFTTRLSKLHSGNLAQDTRITIKLDQLVSLK